jgi:phosphatidylethanolamine/phosphatidyl-N-methylethanolamine N-methyltransferase
VTLSNLLFFREFTRNPKGIGSVMPSGSQLARRMVTAAEIAPGQAVVELGAGTGPVTRVLRDRHPDVDLLLIEPSAELAGVLRQDFPGVPVDERFAKDLPAICLEWGHERIDRVVSGLPWTMWSEDVITAGLDAVVQVLAPGGRMVTFSYVHSQLLLPGARRFRRLLGERFATVTRTEVQWLNVPPALVFVCDVP